MCVILDCTGSLYQAVYRQRTGCERINSQAKELSIERPKVGNRHSVVNLNTLIYLLLTCDHYCVLNPSIKGFYKYISCTPLGTDLVRIGPDKIIPTFRLRHLPPPLSPPRRVPLRLPAPRFALAPAVAQEQ